MEADLRHAVDRGELEMHYQPLISLKNGNIVGFEALLRWHHRELGMVSPAKFIPIAEDSGLIVPITIWILEETCRQLAKWQKSSPTYHNLIMSVNISGKHLSNDELIDDVEHALEVSGIEPGCLKLEITESVAMENAEHTISILTRLKQTGVSLSIDDFGTGYSSLSHLHRLPFDTLKIDRSFVYSVGENGENSEILQTIVSLAKSLKMKIIAEGIETEVNYRAAAISRRRLCQGLSARKNRSRATKRKKCFAGKLNGCQFELENFTTAAKIHPTIICRFFNKTTDSSEVRSENRRFFGE
jgi:EAL domain-containing protein (putative c-di-GMP-specific phosphodiesterase class I)